MQERYTIAVKSKFCVLTTEEDTATEEYERFEKANEEAAKEIIPELKGTRKKQPYNDAIIVKARKRVEEAFKNTNTTQSKAAKNNA